MHFRCIILGKRIPAKKNIYESTGVKRRRKATKLVHGDASSNGNFLWRATLQGCFSRYGSLLYFDIGRGYIGVFILISSAVMVCTLLWIYNIH